MGASLPSRMHLGGVETGERGYGFPGLAHPGRESLSCQRRKGADRGRMEELCRAVVPRPVMCDGQQ